MNYLLLLLFNDECVDYIIIIMIIACVWWLGVFLSVWMCI